MPRRSEEDEKEITRFFTVNSPEKIESYFGSRTKQRKKMAVKIVMLSCNQIVIHQNQCHLYNEAMNKCLAEYNGWRHHTSGGNTSITKKMNANCIIMCHQIKQHNKFMGIDDTDPWKNGMNEFITASRFEDLDDLLSGMFIL